MNARSYRVNLVLSPVDFPAIKGLGESSVFFQSEPYLINNNVVLDITKKYILIETANNKEHEILKAQSVYEIPAKEIKSREDVYEFYKDALLSLNEAYQHARRQMPTLFNITLQTPPIENYKGEIDRVFNLLNSRN